MIDGAAEGGGRATITYRLTARDDGTRFERELVCGMPSAWLAVLDRLLIRRRIAAESAEALRRLKRNLERGAAADGEPAPDELDQSSSANLSPR